MQSSFWIGLPQHHVHHHHQDESGGKADGGEVGVGALGGLLEYLTIPKHLQEVQDIDEFRVAGPANLFIKPYDFVECTPDFFIKFGSNGFPCEGISTDSANPRGFPIDIFCFGPISCFHCFTQTHAAANTIIFQRREAMSIR